MNELFEKVQKAFVDLNGRFAFGTKIRLQTYENLYHMLENDLPLDHCIYELVDRKTARKRPEAVVLKRWHDKMKQGYTFAEAIREHVPSGELSLIGAGERGGKLAEGLKQAHRVTSSLLMLRKQLVSKLAMPATMFAALGFLIIGFSTKMAPEFAKTLPPAQWSQSGQILYAFSLFVKEYWIHSFVGMGVLVAGIALSLSRLTGPVRAKLDRLPPWSIYRTYSSATFLIALSSLMSAGVPILDAVKHVRVTASDWAKSHLNVMVSRMRAGVEYGEALDTGLMDDETSDNVMIYSRLAGFNKAINDIGARVIDEAVGRISVQAALANTISIVLVGLMLAWILSVNNDVTNRASARANNPNVTNQSR